VLTFSSSKYAGDTSLAQLKGAKIGVQISTTSYQAVQDEIAPSGSISVYNTTDDEVNALKDGQVDAIVTDMPTVFYLASAELSNGKIVGQFSYDGGGAPEQFGLLLNKGSGLTSCVDQAIAKLQSSGQLAAITKQWLADSADAPELSK
jgi:polar amino acid transport system substrate-binding protein